MPPVCAHLVHAHVQAQSYICTAHRNHKLYLRSRLLRRLPLDLQQYIVDLAMSDLRTHDVHERIVFRLATKSIYELGVFDPEMSLIVARCITFSSGDSKKWMWLARRVGVELVTRQYYGGPLSVYYVDTERAYAKWVAHLLPDRAARRAFINSLYGAPQ
jgi:hypothetical protein